MLALKINSHIQMSDFQRTIKNIILIVALITPPSFVIAYDDIQIESKIIFNTACARCHEGECSGRLSFHLPKSAADQHIRRHGGELPLSTIRQLFELLRYMKEECGFYPFSQTLIKDKIWNSGTMSKFHSFSKKAYFIPLGSMEPGKYQLLFSGLNDISNICVEIINSEFDFIEKKNIDRNGENQKLQFNVDSYSEYFLRISANSPIRVNQLELVTQGTKGAINTN